MNYRISRTNKYQSIIVITDLVIAVMAIILNKYLCLQGR